MNVGAISRFSFIANFPHFFVPRCSHFWRQSSKQSQKES